MACASCLPTCAWCGTPVVEGPGTGTYQTAAGEGRVLCMGCHSEALSVQADGREGAQAERDAFDPRDNL